MDLIPWLRILPKMTEQISCKTEHSRPHIDGQWILRSEGSGGRAWRSTHRVRLETNFWLISTCLLMTTMHKICPNLESLFYSIHKLIRLVIILILKLGLKKVSLRRSSCPKSHHYKAEWNVKTSPCFRCRRLQNCSLTACQWARRLQMSLHSVVW